jgi:hypothetical protein
MAMKIIDREAPPKMNRKVRRFQKEIFTVLTAIPYSRLPNPTTHAMGTGIA